MSEDIIVILLSFLFLGLLALIPVTILGAEFLYKFTRYGKFETRKYKYWREKKNA